MQFGGNCGTALNSRGTCYREVVVSTEGSGRSLYLWQVRKLRRDNTFDRFSQVLALGAMLV